MCSALTKMDLSLEKFIEAVLSAASRKASILRDEDYLEIIRSPIIREKLRVLENICLELESVLRSGDEESVRDYVKSCVMSFLESILYVEGVRSPEYFRQLYERFKTNMAAVRKASRSR